MLPMTLRDPPAMAGVDLRRADVVDVMRDALGVRLVHADPPWSYTHTAVQGNAADQYVGLPMASIAQHVDAAYDCATEDAYLLCWCTWPKLGEWMPHLLATRWRYVTGGSWHKVGGLGVGYHVRGDSEPWLLCTRGRPRPVGYLRNAYTSEREEHSGKPTGFLRALVRSHGGGGPVLDMYAGLGSMARACLAEHVPYIGAELDHDRHRAALALLRTRPAEPRDGLRGDR